MSLRSWLASRFSAAGNVPPPRPNVYLRYPMLREAGVPVTPETATQVSAVYGCCRLIVDSLAPAPISVVEVKKNGVREAKHDDPIAYTLDWGAPIAQAPDAPTGQAVEEALLWSALLTGNGYAEIQRDNAGRFFGLWPIDPERVQPWRDETGFYYRVSAPYSGAGGGGGTYRLEARDCFHLRGPSLFGWVGDSIVYRAAKAIGIAQAEQVFSAAYFANGTVIAGVLKSDKIVSQTQADEAKDRFRQTLGSGPAAAHDILVLGQGLDYSTISHNAQEAQLVEGKRFQVQEIARFFGVPTTLLADNEAWTNVTELYLGFYRNALLPWASRFDAEATRKLFPQREPWREVQHDLTRVVMGSFKDQIASLKEAVNSGIWTRNEAREITGKNHIGPEGDRLVVDGRVHSLEAVLEAAAEPVTPAGPAKPGAEPDEPLPNKPAPVKNRPASSNVARVAIALDRFERRMSARRADLERNAPDKVESNLADERKRQDEALVSECERALGNGADLRMRVMKAAEAVLAGEPAHLAAERLAEAA